MKDKLARVFQVLALLLLLTLSLGASPSRAQTGSIAGTLVDGKTGDPIIGANVAVQDSTIGTTTDLKGRYELTGLTPGAYALVFSYVGYQKKTVTDLGVGAGETTRLDVQLMPASYNLDEVTVEARLVRNNEAALLRDRQKAAAMSNAISAAKMSQSGSSTAADAIEKVAGASVVGGKYVQMRGLGGRYMNMQLNGAELPSSDPDKNAVPLDLFPAGLLDNVVASKTFTPDQPGNFTGGNINIGTKSYPENLNVTASTSLSYNSEVGFGENMLRASGGLEEVPATISGTNFPNLIAAQQSQEKAQQLDHISRAFSRRMVPIAQSAPLPQSYSLTFGNKYNVLGDRPLGVVGSVTYDQSVSGYADGRVGQHKLIGDVASVSQLNTELMLRDVAGSVQTLMGGLANASFKPHGNHELGLNLLYNRSEEHFARYQTGRLPRDLSEDEVYENRVLRQTERSMYSAQGRGEHVFGSGLMGTGEGLRLKWNSSLTRSLQDEPDLRFFTYHYDPTSTDTTYHIAPSLYPQPTRYFRSMEETVWSNDLSIAVPVGPAEVKVGGSYSQKDRSFREHRFRYETDMANFEGNPANFFGRSGLVGQDESGRYRFGTYIVNATAPSYSYNGDQQVAAGFAMVDTPMPMLTGLRFVGGVRVERTDMAVANLASDPERGQILETDLLPSANLIYAITDEMNARFAYSRTLARPSLREFAPFSSFEFVNGYTYTGNPNLDRTLSTNLDLRWEWFPSPGEILAVSGFYKRLTSPIERVFIIKTYNEIQYQNVGRAMVAGLELEASKNLGGLADVLEHVEIGGNFTLTHSEVAIDPDELALIRATDPGADDTRNLQGQSPYVANADLAYSNPDLGTSVGLYYHLFGERLHAVAKGGNPDLYEQPRHTVDLTASQQLPYNLRVRFSAKNLLDAHHSVVQTFKKRTYTNEYYPQGRSFSLGLSYDL